LASSTVSDRLTGRAGAPLSRFHNLGRISMNRIMAFASALLIVASASAAFAADAVNCTYAGKTYSLGALVCAAKGVAMVCGAPAVLATSAPYNAGVRGKSTDGGWQILQQNNSLVAIQAADPMNSRACDGNPATTP